MKQLLKNHAWILFAFIGTTILAQKNQTIDELKDRFQRELPSSSRP